MKITNKGRIGDTESHAPKKAVHVISHGQLETPNSKDIEKSKDTHKKMRIITKFLQLFADLKSKLVCMCCKPDNQDTQSLAQEIKPDIPKTPKPPVWKYIYYALLTSGGLWIMICLIVFLISACNGSNRINSAFSYGFFAIGFAVVAVASCGDAGTKLKKPTSQSFSVSISLCMAFWAITLIFASMSIYAAVYQANNSFNQPCLHGDCMPKYPMNITNLTQLSARNNTNLTIQN